MWPIKNILYLYSLENKKEWLETPIEIMYLVISHFVGVVYLNMRHWYQI